MATQVKQLAPPAGISRFFYRLPIWLYKLGLGGLLGNRFLLLHHVGRKTGLPRQAVLEVVRFDKHTQTYIVAVGFGPKTDWYQNVTAHPQVTLQAGWRKFDMLAEQLSPEEAGLEIVRFARRHPLEAKFASILGFEVDGTEADYIDMGRQMTLIAFRPRA